MKSLLNSISDKFKQDTDTRAVSTAINRDRIIKFAYELKTAGAHVDITDYSVSREKSEESN